MRCRGTPHGVCWVLSVLEHAHVVYKETSGKHVAEPRAQAAPAGRVPAVIALTRTAGGAGGGEPPCAAHGSIEDNIHRLLRNNGSCRAQSLGIDAIHQSIVKIPFKISARAALPLQPVFVEGIKFCCVEVPIRRQRIGTISRFTLTKVGPVEEYILRGVVAVLQPMLVPWHGGRLAGLRVELADGRRDLQGGRVVRLGGAGARYVSAAHHGLQDVHLWRAAALEGVQVVVVYGVARRYLLAVLLLAITRIERPEHNTVHACSFSKGRSGDQQQSVYQGHMF